MELHQVRYYVALCKALNFTRAAEACNVTQPALTRAIQRLEEELGGPLFQRERNLTQLTELGRLMRPLLEQTLAAAEAAKEHATRFRKSEVASLRLGLPPTISARVVTASLQELTRRIPTLDLELKMAGQDALIEALLQGEIDAAFLDQRKDLPERFTSWPLFKEHYRLAFAAAHPLASHDAIALAALNGQALLGRRDCDVAARLQELCAAAQVTPQLRHTSDSEEHIQHLALAGLGIALVPEHLPILPALVTRPLAEPVLQRGIVLAVVSGRRFSPALDAFVRLTRTRDFAHDFAIAA
jgi:DNA-binding transcriptional LysR family regulator